MGWRNQPFFFLNGHFSPNVVNHYIIQSLPEDQLTTVMHVICIGVGGGGLRNIKSDVRKQDMLIYAKAVTHLEKRLVPLLGWRTEA